MGLDDITIFNANGGNKLSLINNEQKNSTEIEYLLGNESDFLVMYSLNRNQK